MTALAVRDDQEYWDKHQLAVLAQSGIEQDVTEAELSAFLHECQRRKLDPFSRQIYLIGRYDRRKGRKVYKSQTSIDGFRLIARRAADKSGIDYSYEDTIWYDAKGGRHDIWLSGQPPAGAKVVVIRNGCRFDAVARTGAYVQTDRDGRPSGQWVNMADVMIAKCAEALALRKAFPEDLGGIYTEEEMGQADNPQRVQGTVIEVSEEPAAAVTTDEDWLGSVIRRIPDLPGTAECRGLWGEVAAQVRDRKCSDGDAARLGEMIRARVKELGQPKQAQNTVSEDDPWLIRIRDIATPEEADAVRAEMAEAFAGTPGDDARAVALFTAVDTRVAELARKTAA